MLIGEVFEEFIRVVQEGNQYTIGLVNADARVVLCSNPSMVNTIVDMHHPDVENVYYQIIVKEQDFGYLWVHGEDENLTMIARLLSESLTVRLMYELNQSDLHQKVTKEDELVRYLLNTESFDRTQILNLMEELDIDKDKTRVAILVINKNGFHTKNITRLKMKPDSAQVIYSLINSRTLLLFKDIPDHMKDHDEVNDYLDAYIQTLQEWDINHCLFFTGSLQRKLKHYAISYENCNWLKLHLNAKEDVPLHFCDYLPQYYLSQITSGSVMNIFGYYQDQRKHLDVNELVEITDQLIAADFNLTHAADALFLHKNTLIYKLKKYEEIFQIDIRNSFEGKILLVLLSNALKEYQKYEQVGDSV